MQLKTIVKKSCLLILLVVACYSQAGEKVLLDIIATPEGESKQYTQAQLLAFPQHEITTNLPWTEEKHTYSGPYLEDVLQASQVAGQWLSIEALDKYKVDVNFEKIKEFKPILALKRDGKLLTIRTKGPIWLILPVDYHSELSAALYNDFMVWHLVRIGVQVQEPK